jgi:hypothetical protein
MNSRMLLILSMLAAGVAEASDTQVNAIATNTPSVMTEKELVNAIDPQLHAELLEVGRGRFDYLFWHIYDAQLQSIDGKFIDYQQSAPILLSLTYQRDISKADFIDATLDQWQHQHGEVEPRHQEWALLLTDIWRDVKAGDTLSCQRLANGEVQFFLNKNYLGRINDPKFADEFLDIWLGVKTSAPKLRKQLIQNASGQKT